jgi:hypothetical protein
MPPRDTATVCFVADHVDAAWDEIGKYLLHDAMSYSEWNPGNDVSANIIDAKTPDELRQTSSSHVILTTDEAVSRMRGGEVLNVSPLCGGLPPDWRGPTCAASPHWANRHLLIDLYLAVPPGLASSGWGWWRLRHRSAQGDSRRQRPSHASARLAPSRPRYAATLRVSPTQTR